MKPYVILIIFSMLSFGAMAQLASPVLHCDSVHPDGSVTIVWEQVSDPGGIFTGYSVYYRPQPAAAFTLAGQVMDIAQTTFIHLTSAANDRSRFYYVVAESTSGPSLPSDTLETIFLYFETDDNENISLFWNATHDPPLPSPDVEYRLYREYPPGNWELLTQTPGLSFDHHFWFCNNSQHVVNFQGITYDATTSCESVSNISGTILSNLAQPDTPNMDSVSITAGGEAIIGWQPGLAQDISGYIVYRVTSINDSIDFVTGIGNTSYIDSKADPCNAPVRYAIAAVDSCGNKSPGTFLEPHTTLFLEEFEYDPCCLVNELTWNEYVNFDPPLQGYEVHASADGAPFSLLSTVAPGETSYTHTGLSPNTHYAYFIRAFNQGGGKTSTSCIREMQTYNSPFPQYMYMLYVTVNEDNSVDISFYSDTSAHVQGYRIFRSKDQAAFQEIGEVDPLSGTDILNYTDEEASTWSESYYYQVSVIDSCSNESFLANTSRTIWLQVDSDEDLINTLTWNGYQTWDGGVEGYRVYRRSGQGSPALEIGSTGPGQLQYLHDISSLGNTTGRISYYVEAFEGAGNQYGFREVSRSNEVLADVVEKVFVPNAIRPNGRNRTLKPLGTFISEDNYLFSIYNRWGQLIFQTGNPSEAWDGKYDGRVVEQGVYVYILSFTSATGEVIQRKGTVAVIF